MPTFTAGEVRKMQAISECGCGQALPDTTGFFCSFCRRRAMLDAFAARLEQDEIKAAVLALATLAVGGPAKS